MLSQLSSLARGSNSSTKSSRAGSSSSGDISSGSGSSGISSGISSEGGASRLWAVLLSSGGHFAAAVFDAEDGGRVVAHQTFHR